MDDGGRQWVKVTNRPYRGRMVLIGTKHTYIISIYSELPVIIDSIITGLIFKENTKGPPLPISVLQV